MSAPDGLWIIIGLVGIAVVLGVVVPVLLGILSASKKALLIYRLRRMVETRGADAIPELLHALEYEFRAVQVYSSHRSDFDVDVHRFSAWQLAKLAKYADAHVIQALTRLQIRYRKYYLVGSHYHRDHPFADEIYLILDTMKVNELLETPHDPQAVKELVFLLKRSRNAYIEQLCLDALFRVDRGLAIDGLRRLLSELGDVNEFDETLVSESSDYEIDGNVLNDGPWRKVQHPNETFAYKSRLTQVLARLEIPDRALDRVPRAVSE